MTPPLLSVSELTVSAPTGDLVRRVSFSLDAGSRLGIIGESGSGKTLTALAILGLLPDNLSAVGSIRFDGAELADHDETSMCALRGNAMSMIFQEPMSALNPVMRIGRQIAEPLRIHRDRSPDDAMAQAIELLDRVGIDEPRRRARSFPHELSGGQRQRAMIAMALACSPMLVIADEPTTALDVTVQAQVLDLLRDQVVADDTALILITHDLPVVASITDRVVVMKDGAVVEEGRTAEVFARPGAAYTAGLVDAVPPMSRSVSAPSTASDPGSDTADELVGDPIVSVDAVTKRYRLRRTRLLDAPPVIDAVAGVTVDIHPGETFGIVGESGSGKSTLARMIVGLTSPTSGRITVDGIDVAAATGDGLRTLRETVQMVFQDPLASLDPRMRVGDIVAEPLRALRKEGDHRATVGRLLDAVALPADSVDRFPHEFSGGQRQRIAIARALAPQPRLLVADEPVSALDMSVQTTTLELLADLKQRFDLTVVFISHDLSVVHEICERVIVLERGAVVERGSVGAVLGAPSEPYTKRLVAAIPRLVTD